MIFEIIEDIFNAAKWPIAVVVFDKFVLQKIPIPEYVKKNHNTAKWKHEVAALTNATILAVGAPIALYFSPAQSVLESRINSFGKSLLEYSTAFYIYDSFKIIVDRPFNKLLTIFFVLHHSICDIVLVTCINDKRYEGLILTSLLMEVNSVFVHTRLLLKYSGKTENAVFPTVKMLNLVTNIPFRYYVGKHVIERMLARPNYSRDSKWYFAMTSIGIISTLNILVLVRVFHQDFILPFQIKQRTDK